MPRGAGAGRAPGRRLARRARAVSPSLLAAPRRSRVLRVRTCCWGRGQGAQHRADCKGSRPGASPGGWPLPVQRRDSPPRPPRGEQTPRGQPDPGGVAVPAPLRTERRPLHPPWGYRRPRPGTSCPRGPTWADTRAGRDDELQDPSHAQAAGSRAPGSRSGRGRSPLRDGHAPAHTRRQPGRAPPTDLDAAPPYSFPGAAANGRGGLRSGNPPPLHWPRPLSLPMAVATGWAGLGRHPTRRSRPRPHAFHQLQPPPGRGWCQSGARAGLLTRLRGPGCTCAEYAAARSGPRPSTSTPTRCSDLARGVRVREERLIGAAQGEVPQRLLGRAALVQLHLDVHRQGLGLVAAIEHYKQRFPLF